MGEQKTVDLVRAAAKKLNRELIAINALPGPSLDLPRSIAEGARADAWLVDEYPMFSPHRSQIIQLIAAQRKPAMFSSVAWAREGGLLAYSADAVDLWRRAAGYVDRILRGGNPAELPVEEPTRFVLAINLRTARFFGIEVQRNPLLQANELIE